MNLKMGYFPISIIFYFWVFSNSYSIPLMSNLIWKKLEFSKKKVMKIIKVHHLEIEDIEQEHELKDQNDWAQGRTKTLSCPSCSETLNWKSSS